MSIVQDLDGILWRIDTWRLFKYDGYTYNGGYRLFDSPAALEGISGGRRDYVCVYSSVNELLFPDAVEASLMKAG